MNGEPLQTEKPDLELQQGSIGTRIKYRFFSDYVEYMVHDRMGGIVSFNAKYAGLPSKVEYGVYQPARRPVFLNQVLILMAITLLVILIYRQNPDEMLSYMVIFGAIGIICSLVLRRFLRKTYTSIPANNRKILVMRDRKHDEILQALESRRLRALHKLAVIDPLNTPQLELRKFIWLKEQGVITEQECSSLRQKLIDSTKELGRLTPPPKPPGEIIQ